MSSKHEIKHPASAPVEEVDLTAALEDFDAQSQATATKTATIDQILGIDTVVGDSGVPKAVVTPPPAVSLEQILADKDMMSELAKALEALQKGTNGVKLSAEKPKKVDYTKLTEKDAFNYEIPLEAVNFDLPDYLKVTLKDKSYEPRWVNLNPARLGPMKGAGFTPVVREDLEKDLDLAISTNANGYYTYIDVILMKVQKSRLYAALRNNHLRSLLMTDPKKLHEIQKAKMNDYMMEQSPSEVSMWNYAQSNKDSTGKPKMGAYIPGEI